MNTLASLLRELRDSESPGQGTPETPGSSSSAARDSELPRQRAPETPGSHDYVTDTAMRVLCDDCGRPTVIALVTDYGARYCRACVFPTETRGAQKGTR